MKIKELVGKLMLTAAFLGLLAGTAFADSVIDFAGNGGTTGLISYSANTIVGTNIPITMVAGISTPLNDGSILPVTNGYLNFSTGAYQYTDGGGNYVFGNGGNLTITGSVPGAGINSTTTLLSGSFLGAIFDPTFGSLALGTATGTDTKDATLVSYFFGSNPPPSWAFSGTIIFNPNTGRVTSTDISNASVPEPGSILLLGTTALGVAGLMRRRKKNSRAA
jgi:hypothetical protein